MHVELVMFVTVVVVLVDVDLGILVVPYPAFAIRQQFHSGRLVQGHDLGAGSENGDGTVEEPLHVLADPDDEVRGAQHFGVGWAHLVRVR